MRAPLFSVHVDDGRSWRGGQGQVLLLVRGLVERGQPAVLLARPDSPLFERARESGLTVEGLPLAGEWDLLSAVAIARRLGRSRADVLHAHTASAHTLSGPAGRLAGTPLVVAARRVHHRISRFGRFKLTRLADRVITVSHDVRRVLLECGVPAGQIDVVHSGVDLRPPDAGPGGPDGPASLRRDLGLEDAWLVGAAGALVGHKDHVMLIDAAAALRTRLPRARFVIAGSGKLEGDLRSRIARLGLEHIVLLLGFRPDFPRLLAELDVFVQCSSDEGLGTALLEAMSRARPVVATRAGGIPEAIEDGRDGLLVPARDPAALAEALARLANSPELSTRLGRGARARVEADFDAERMVDATLALYRRHLE